jgi:hypothetical protein
MNPERHSVAALRGLWGADPGEPGDTDYRLLAEVEGAFIARARDGLPALFVPMKDLGTAPVGRRASGCELIGHSSTRFVFQGRDAVGPAAALLCIDPDLFDAFAVLAMDVAQRVRDSGGTWSSMLSAVEEWQTLLAPRGRPSAETEEGLWGELWFLSQAEDVEQAFAAWCGPDGGATDFFLGGRSAEVKTSRHHRQHHVSLSQVDAPVGTHDAWLLSIWVKVDPGTSSTVVQLAERFLDRVRDRSAALRRLARAGYSPADKSGYAAAFVVLAEPEWYAAADIPRVRAADPGVSHLRYRVALDETRRADGPLSDSLWQHFHGHKYGGERR